LVQAVVSKGKDLTGSHIISDKDIAVFGGHKRADVPYNDE